MNKKIFKIALLFNANKAYDRQIIEGVGHYLQESQSHWDVFVEDDFKTQTDKINYSNFDGIISDFDDIRNKTLLDNPAIPVIGVGGSYSRSEDYPPIDYVATDNVSLVEQAFHHLIDKGIERFALYSFPECPSKRWAIERENAFQKIANQRHYKGEIYRGMDIDTNNWNHSQLMLINWISTLEQGTGIIAVTDSRARHLLQACELADMPVPERLAIIGIDNEEITGYLSRISLTSVVQGSKEMGYQAARLLHKRLQGEQHHFQRVLIPAVRVVERRSTDYRAIMDPFVIKAMHFIRNNACNGIKVEQVLDVVNLSRTNLENRFKTELRSTVHSIIHNEKLERAKNLITTTSLSMNDIYKITSYPSLQYFYTVFKKQYGMTPKKYREKYNINNFR